MTRPRIIPGQALRCGEPAHVAAPPRKTATVPMDEWTARHDRRPTLREWIFGRDGR